MDGRLRVLAVIAGIALMQSPAWAAPLPKPTHTNKSQFLIPFKFDAPSLQRMNAREIQLHVSRDHGATWELAQTLAPDGGKFKYQATSEGEYWFSVKTLDGRNQLHPPTGSYETGLIVVIDQTPPTLDASLQQVAGGKVELSWRASDPNLDASTLKFEFLAPESQNWEAIPIVPHNRGETSWAVNLAGVVSVRGTVSDYAGNVGYAKTQIDVNGTVERGVKLKHRGPVAETPTGSSGNLVAKEALSISLPSVSTISSGSAPSEPSEDREYQGPVITPLSRLQRYPQTNEASSPMQDQWPTSASNDPSVFPPIAGGTSRGTSALRNFTTSQSATLQAQKQQPRRAAARQRIVNTRRFQINYKLDDIGPSGIGSVELFITEDNGRKWWKYGDDPDQKSPFDVEVPRDGVYGFSIRVRSGAGLANEPPVPNEPPEQVVAVDQTPPVIELLPYQQGKGANVHRLRFRWKVTEEHPSDKPVSLCYATSLNGPWEPICDWREDLNNTFDWTVGPGVPSQFYVKVLYRDSAGNLGKSETPQPIVVDLVQPTARIVDVEVAPGSPPQ